MNKLYTNAASEKYSVKLFLYYIELVHNEDAEQCHPWSGECGMPFAKRAPILSNKAPQFVAFI